MASLAEVYERKGRSGGHASPQQVVMGVSLFLVGAVMVIIGLVLASTEILSLVGVGRFESRRIAGLLGGLGVPAVFVGILSVLPAGDRIRLAAAIGAGVAVVGVALFWTVYPSQWLGASVDRHYTFETTAIYFLGTFVTFWCFFVAVVNFKTRNDPGGTVELEVIKAGQTRIVEVDRSAIRSGLGGIGLLGSTPSTPTPTTVSDGGSTGEVIRSPADRDLAPHDEGVDVTRTARPQDSVADRYCGNCTHFRYDRHDTGVSPYCTYHERAMTDMDPCEAWTPNRAD